MNWDSKAMSETVKLVDNPLVTWANDFDVTDYISGPGEYSFCLKFSGTTDAVFHSTESDNKPTLTLEVPTGAITVHHAANVHGLKEHDHNDYERNMADVVRRGQAYRRRYTAFNPTAAPRNGADDILLVGYFDVTKHPYLAKGDNETDDTKAIQRAINEARDAQVAVYFPKDCKFKVSEPIDCVQGLLDYENYLGAENFKSTDYERANHRDFPCVLMGAVLPQGDVRRPELVIASDSTDFNVASAPKPLLRFWSRSTGEVENSTPQDNYPAANYNHLIRNLDINLSGKDGAIGITMVGTQGTAIESLRINANGALAGIRGLPGAGGCTSDVIVKGGMYGIDGFKATDELAGITSVLNNCTIDADQDGAMQINSVRWNNYGPLVLVGCFIKGGPIEIQGPSGDQSGEAARGNLSIVDSKIWITRSGAPRSAIKGSRAAYLRNVYCKQITAVADISTTIGAGDSPVTSIPAQFANFSSRWILVKEYAEGAVLDQDPDHPSPSDTGPTPRYVDGVGIDATSNLVPPSVGLYDTNGGSYYTDADIPTSLISRHDWPPVLDWDSADVINVRDDYGAVGDNYTDDAEAIQDAIEATNNPAHEDFGKKVFIPAGQYVLNSQLILHAGTVLFGLHKNYSVLKANDHPRNIAYASATSFNGGSSKTALIKTEDDIDGNTRLSDLMLLQRMTAVDTYLLHWSVGGSGATVQNVNFERRIVNKEKFGTPGPLPLMDIPLIKITAAGGGRWYSMNHQSSGTVSATYRNILIEGSTVSATPTLRFYMFNPEIDAGSTFNAVVLDRTNLDVFGSKSEGKEMPFVRIKGGKDIRWIGMGGNGYCDPFQELDPQTNEMVPTGVNEAVIEIDNCPSFVISSCSYHKIGAKNTDSFYRLKDIISGSPTVKLDATKGFVSYRRGPTITTGTAGINDRN